MLSLTVSPPKYRWSILSPNLSRDFLFILNIVENMSWECELCSLLLKGIDVCSVVQSDSHGSLWSCWNWVLGPLGQIYYSLIFLPMPFTVSTDRIFSVLAGWVHTPKYFSTVKTLTFPFGSLDSQHLFCPRHPRVLLWICTAKDTREIFIYILENPYM